MAGKGGKGLQATKTTAAKSTDKDKDKKKAPRVPLLPRWPPGTLLLPFSPLLFGSSLPCFALF
jgi:hypothetical protein